MKRTKKIVFALIAIFPFCFLILALSGCSRTMPTAIIINDSLSKSHGWTKTSDIDLDGLIIHGLPPHMYTYTNWHDDNSWPQWRAAHSFDDKRYKPTFENGRPPGKANGNATEKADWKFWEEWDKKQSGSFNIVNHYNGEAIVDESTTPDTRTVIPRVKAAYVNNAVPYRYKNAYDLSPTNPDVLDGGLFINGKLYEADHNLFIFRGIVILLKDFDTKVDTGEYRRELEWKASYKNMLGGTDTIVFTAEVLYRVKD